MRPQIPNLNHGGGYMNSRIPVAWIALALLSVALASCQSRTTTTQGDDLAPAGTMQESATPRVTTHIGRGFSSDSTQIAASATNFGATENVYAVVNVDTPVSGTMRVVWSRGDAASAADPTAAGATIHEESIPMSEATTHYRFALDSPDQGFAVGPYRLQVFVNDQPVAMERFEVGGNPASP